MSGVRYFMFECFGNLLPREMWYEVDGLGRYVVIRRIVMVRFDLCDRVSI